MIVWMQTDRMNDKRACKQVQQDRNAALQKAETAFIRNASMRDDGSK